MITDFSLSNASALALREERRRPQAARALPAPHAVSQSSSVGRVSRGIMHVFAGEEMRERSSKAMLRRRVGFRTGRRLVGHPKTKMGCEL